jgi:hypothetical protein
VENRFDETSIWSRNLSELSKAYPDLAALIRSTCASDQLHTMIARSGEVTARYGEISLHSSHAPRREAERIVADSGVPTGCYIVEGFGLGYITETLVETHPSAHVVVVEPDIPLFAAVLKARDFRELFARERVHYLFGTDAADQIMDILNATESTDFQTIRFRPQYDQHREYYQKVESRAAAYLSRTRVNQNTLIRFGELWVRNLTRNLPVFTRSRRLADLEGLFPALPGILLGGGPSLDLVLPHLREIARSCIVVTVDTSLAACRSAGVEPDFVVVVDPQYWNTRHLDRAAGAKAPLISESSTHPRVFRLLSGPIHFCSSLFPLGQYIEARTGPMGKLGAGGSVSTSAWDFLRILGCTPIYTSGVDLGFPGRQTHFRGSFFEERIQTIATRLAPGEHHSFRYLHEAGLFPVPDNSGTTVLSDKRMLIYRTWFEGQAKRFPECDTRSLSPHAVQLQGVSYANIEEVLSLPDLPGTARSKLEEIGKLHENASPPVTSTKNLIDTVNTLRTELLEIEALAVRGTAIVTEAEHTLSQSENIVPNLELLNQLDSEISANPNRDIVGFLMQRNVRELNNQNPELVTAEKVLQNSRSIYEGLLESSRFHRKCLENGLSWLNHSPSA